MGNTVADSKVWLTPLREAAFGPQPWLLLLHVTSHMCWDGSLQNAVAIGIVTSSTRKCQSQKVGLSYASYSFLESRGPWKSEEKLQMILSHHVDNWESWLTSNLGFIRTQAFPSPQTFLTEPQGEIFHILTCCSHLEFRQSGILSPSKTKLLWRNETELSSGKYWETGLVGCWGKHENSYTHLQFWK